MLKVLTIIYREELALAQATFYSPIFRCLAAARILLFPKTIAQFKSMKLMGKLKHPTRKHDPLYFLVHHYYISRQFTLRQRVDVAMEHHKYELQVYNCEYMRQVYRSNGAPTNSLEATLLSLIFIRDLPPLNSRQKASSLYQVQGGLYD